MPTTEKSLLRNSENYRDLILLLEVAALLHDVGKLSPFFIISKAKGFVTKDFHGQIVFIDLGYPDYKKRIIRSKLEKFLFTPINEILNIPKTIKGIDLSINISNFICAHHGCSRCLNFVYECHLKDSIENHPLIKLLKTVDHLDASNPSDSRKQGAYEVYRDNFFLCESKIDVRSLNPLREQFYSEVEKIISLPVVDLNKQLKKLVKKYFINSLSETRRFGNDITLLDHSEATASYYKTYLFNYFVRSVNFPNSFFDCKFRLMKTQGNSKETEEKISYELAFANKIFETDSGSFYLIPNIRSNVFFEFIKQYTNTKIEFSKTNDFSFLFSSNIGKTNLEIYFSKLKKFVIKNPQDINALYSEGKLVNEVKKVIYFATLRKKERLSRKLKSYSKHLENVKNGIEHSEGNLKKYYKKLREIEKIKSHINKGISVEKIKKAFGWHSSKDAEKEIYDFFNLILSPIRPPSQVEMSNYFLKRYNKLRSFKKVYKELIEIRPIVLGRVLAYLRTIKGSIENKELIKK